MGRRSKGMGPRKSMTFKIDSEVWEQLKAELPGKRSDTVNLALRAWLGGSARLRELERQAQEAAQRLSDARAEYQEAESLVQSLQLQFNSASAQAHARNENVCEALYEGIARLLYNRPKSLVSKPDRKAMLAWIEGNKDLVVAGPWSSPEAALDDALIQVEKRKSEYLERMR